jgi:LysR family transcriptional regulator, low CO2-responsive transcriptional regulator
LATTLKNQMDTQRLRIFRAVVRHNGLPNAARELNLSPSALSHALKALEQEIGCRLFERTGNRLVLNYAGEQLLAGVEGPLLAIESAAASVRELGRWGQVRLRVGVPVTACQHILPGVFRQLRKEFPKAPLLVETGNMTQLIALLRENRIDLAIGVEPERGPDLELRALFDDELLFVLSASHPWSSGRPISRDAIRQEALILYHRTSRTSQLINHYFQDLDVDPWCTMEIASISAIKAMVQLDLGVSVLAPWVVDSELSRGTLKMRPLGSKSLKRHWVIAYLARRRLSLVEERFSVLCRAQVTGLRLDRKDLPETGRVQLR